MVEDSVFPEDTGTGAPYGDFDDAANWASHAYNEDYGNYVIAGIDLQPDYANNFLETTAGKARISDESATATRAEVERPFGVTYDVIIGGRSDGTQTNTDDLTLDADSVNDVWLAIDLEHGDRPYIVVSSVSGDEPTDPHIKIGEVDTTNEVVDQGFNRRGGISIVRDELFADVADVEDDIDELVASGISRDELLADVADDIDELFAGKTSRDELFAYNIVML